MNLDPINLSSFTTYRRDPLSEMIIAITMGDFQSLSQAREAILKDAQLRYQRQSLTKEYFSSLKDNSLMTCIQKLNYQTLRAACKLTGPEINSTLNLIQALLLINRYHPSIGSLDVGIQYGGFNGELNQLFAFSLKKFDRPICYLLVKKDPFEVVTQGIRSIDKLKYDEGLDALLRVFNIDLYCLFQNETKIKYKKNLIEIMDRFPAESRINPDFKYKPYPKPSLQKKISLREKTYLSPLSSRIELCRIPVRPMRILTSQSVKYIPRLVSAASPSTHMAKYLGKPSQFWTPTKIDQFTFFIDRALCQSIQTVFESHITCFTLLFTHSSKRDDKVMLQFKGKILVRLLDQFLHTHKSLNQEGSGSDSYINKNYLSENILGLISALFKNSLFFELNSFHSRIIKLLTQHDRLLVLRRLKSDFFKAVRSFDNNISAKTFAKQIKIRLQAISSIDAGVCLVIMHDLLKTADEKFLEVLLFLNEELNLLKKESIFSLLASLVEKKDQSRCLIIFETELKKITTFEDYIFFCDRMLEGTKKYFVFPQQNPSNKLSQIQKRYLDIIKSLTLMANANPLLKKSFLPLLQISIVENFYVLYFYCIIGAIEIEFGKEKLLEKFYDICKISNKNEVHQLLQKHKNLIQGKGITDLIGNLNNKVDNCLKYISKLNVQQVLNYKELLINSASFYVSFLRLLLFAFKDQINMSKHFVDLFESHYSPILKEIKVDHLFSQEIKNLKQIIADEYSKLITKLEDERPKLNRKKETIFSKNEILKAEVKTYQEELKKMELIKNLSIKICKEKLRRKKNELKQNTNC